MMTCPRVLFVGCFIMFTAWLFAPMRVRLAFSAAAAAFLVVWRAWRAGRSVAWTMKVGHERAGFEVLFGVCVCADNIRAWTPKHGEAFKEPVTIAERAERDLRRAGLVELTAGGGRSVITAAGREALAESE